MSILKNNSPIGFFDSGVGGLTVLKRLKELLPNENIIFYGDSAHVPYGEKTEEELLSYAKNILAFFAGKDCKAVVMACNTTSSLIYNDIKGLYDFKLYPVVQSVAQVIAQLPIKRLGVFATKATIESNAYPNEIHKYREDMQIFGQYCPNWVKIVEANTVENPESVLDIKDNLNKMLENNPEKIILGCTHYPYLLGILSKYAPEDMFIDPSISFAKFIKDDLTECNLLNKGNDLPTEEFYVSASPSLFKEAAARFYKLKKNPVLIEF